MVDDRKAAAIKKMTTAKEEKPNLLKLIAKFSEARDEMPALTARDRAIMTNAGVTPPKSRMTKEQAMKLMDSLKGAMQPQGIPQEMLSRLPRKMKPATPPTPMGRKGGGMMKAKKKKAKKTKRAGRLAKRGYGAAKK